MRRFIQLVTTAAVLAVVGASSAHAEITNPLTKRRLESAGFDPVIEGPWEFDGDPNAGVTIEGWQFDPTYRVLTMLQAVTSGNWPIGATPGPFAPTLQISNTSTDPNLASEAGILLGGGNDAVLGFFYADGFGQVLEPAGNTPKVVLGSITASPVGFYAGFAPGWWIDPNDQRLYPEGTGVKDIGDPNHRVRNIYLDPNGTIDGFVGGAPTPDWFVFPDRGMANTNNGCTTSGRTRGARFYAPAGVTFSHITMRVQFGEALPAPSGSLQLWDEAGTTQLLGCDNLDWTAAGVKLYDINVDCDSATDSMTLQPGTYAVTVNCNGAAVRFHSANGAGQPIWRSGVDANCVVDTSCLNGTATAQLTTGLSTVAAMPIVVFHEND